MWRRITVYTCCDTAYYLIVLYIVFSTIYASWALIYENSLECIFLFLWNKNHLNIIIYKIIDIGFVDILWVSNNILVSYIDVKMRKGKVRLIQRTVKNVIPINVFKYWNHIAEIMSNIHVIGAEVLLLRHLNLDK